MRHSADELVRRYVLREYRAEYQHSNLRLDSRHLAVCSETVVESCDSSDGSYGCQTGCDYVRFKATLSCPHGFSEEYEFGEFGELADIISSLERDVESE